MSMDSFAIELRQVSKRFPTPGGGEVLAVHDVSLQIRDGEFFSLLGPSGCGKTTTLRIIAGFELPSAGEILIHGKPMGATPPFKRPVNTVFQHYALFPHMSVGENVAFGLQMKGVPRSEIDQRVSEALRMVRLEGMEDRKPKQLSGGQQQRVAVARALINRPEVLLLDEPLGALDLKLRKEMQLELKTLQREVGITFIYVTHDQEEALTMSDRIAVMNQGVVLQVGTPADIYEHPADRFVADFIGESNLLEGVVAGRRGEVLEIELVSGVRICAHAHRDVRQGQPVVVAIRPEKINLNAGLREENQLIGRLEGIIYIGTDTNYELRLPGGQLLRVRQQNRVPGSQPLAQTGDEMAVSFPVEAALVLVE
jgi:spermidine/putrescine transport system ATP-binding protein